MSPLAKLKQIPALFGPKQSGQQSQPIPSPISAQSIKSVLDCAKDGNSKTELLQLLTNVWDLTPIEEQRLELAHYYLLHWEGSYVKQEIYEGIITHNNICYCVIYRSCSPSNVFKNPSVRLSFRASPLGNFVLVQPVYR